MTVVQRWLDSLSPNTRRNYRSAMAAFLRFNVGSEVYVESAGVLLKDVTTAQIFTWLNTAQQDGTQPATLNVHRAALASFYRHAREVEGWQIADPLSGIRAHSVTPYGRSRYPTAVQVNKLLSVIPNTVAGKRDIAVLLGMFVTTRRVSEWLLLRGDNLHPSKDGYWFSYVAKGGSEQRQIIPARLWQCIEEYLVAAGRWPLPCPNAPIFVRIGDSSQAGKCLSTGYVRRAMAQYGVAAELPIEICHPHGLRHAGARARKEAGQSAWELQNILAHKHLGSTTIYTRQVLEDPKDAFGDSIAQSVWPAKQA